VAVGWVGIFLKGIYVFVCLCGGLVQCAKRV